MIKKFESHDMNSRIQQSNGSTQEPDIILTVSEDSIDQVEKTTQAVPSEGTLTTENETNAASNNGISISRLDLGAHSGKTKVKSPKLAEHSSKHLQPPVSVSQDSYNLSDVEHYECACDGVKVVPLQISTYDKVNLMYKDYSPVHQFGRSSYTYNQNGDIVSCVVLKLRNCFAIPMKDSEEKVVNLSWCMDRMDILKKVRASDGNVYLDVLLRDELGQKKIRVPYNSITESGINSLAKYNVRLFRPYTMPMAIYLQKLADELPMEDASQQIGIVTDPVSDRLVFNGYSEGGAFTVESEYDTFEDYLCALNQLLKESKPLQYLLSATMAAPILTILQQQFNYDLHSYCINIVGASSTGKTIASRLCASVWTNPNDDVIFSAMLATGNAALKRLAGRYGIPTFMDESTVLGGIKSDEYAYSVYEGREKRRLNSDCSEKASGTWSTIACMSSEQHFHSNAKNQNGGLAVRVHSMENLEWTASKEHAAAVSDFSMKNYGVLGMQFTNILLQESVLEQLPDSYESAKKAMAIKCEKEHNDFTDRLCNIYALTLMTAKLLARLGAAIDTEAVARIMADHNAMVAGEQNLALNAFNAIVSYITRYGDKSGIKFTYINENQPISVAIEQGLFAEILERAGFKDLKVTLKELKKSGYIIRQTEKGVKSKLTISGNVCWCYQIDLRSLSTETNADVKRLERKRSNFLELVSPSEEDECFGLENDDD